MSKAPFSAAQHAPHEGEVHVWSVPRASDFPAIAHLAACLSSEEKTRAARVRDAAARARFITAHVALRHILAGYLRRDPDSLHLRVEPLGKPVIDATPGIHFSLSHARDITLLAFASAPVGIDVEHIREPPHLSRVARRVLHEDTCRALEQTPAHLRAELFMHAWTVREAHVKAVGGGLFHTADTLPFTPVDGAVAGIRHVRDRHDDTVWSVAQYRPDATSVAAVIARGEMHTLHFLSWIPEHGDAP